MVLSYFGRKSLAEFSSSFAEVAFVSIAEVVGPMVEVASSFDLESEQAVRIVLGRNLLICYPFFIIIM